MKRYFPGYLFPVLAGIILSVVSCETKRKPGELVDNDIKFDSIRIIGVQYLFNDTTKPNCNLDLKFVYPVSFKSDKVLDSLRNQFIVNFFGSKYSGLSPQQAADHFKADYLSDYKNVEKEYLDDKARNTEEETAPRSWYSYYKVGTVNIEFNKNDLLGYMISAKEYAGGRHGAHSYLYHLVNLKTGQPINEKDVFTGDFQTELSKILVEELARQNNVKTPEELYDIGYIGAIELLPNDNFMIDENGITYLYNEYEIASYDISAVKIFVPYEKLKNLLNLQSPVAELAGL